MKVFRFFIYLSIAVIFTGCQDDSDIEQLKAAYHLMDVDSIDDADMIIGMYSETNKDKEYKALYNLSKARLAYKQMRSNDVKDSLLTYPINYYKNIRQDKYMLSESYFYRGAILLDQMKYEDATKYLREAELLAIELKNNESIHKIDEQLCIAYYNSGLYEIGKEYAKRAMSIAKEEKNYDWYAYASEFLYNYHFIRGEIDSAQYYINGMKPYIKLVNKKNRDIFLTNLAKYYIGIDNNQALDYIKQALQLRPSAYAYTTLARIYVDGGNNEKALNVLSSNLKEASVLDSLNMIEMMITLKADDHDFESAYNLMNIKEKLSDKVNNTEREHNMMKVQAQYNTLAKERDYQLTVQKITVAIVIFSVIIIIVFFYISLRMLKMKKRQLTDQYLIETYNAKIKDLESSGMDTSQQVKELKSRVSQLQVKQSGELKDGKKLYEHVMNNGSMVSWDKSDYNKFFSYYNLVNMELMVKMEREYDNLPVRSMIYLILCDMNKTEDEMERICGISRSSIRSIKSRTRSRYKGETEEE